MIIGNMQNLKKNCPNLQKRVCLKYLLKKVGFINVERLLNSNPEGEGFKQRCNLAQKRPALKYLAHKLGTRGRNFLTSIRYFTSPVKHTTRRWGEGRETKYPTPPPDMRYIVQRRKIFLFYLKNDAF